MSRPLKVYGWIDTANAEEREALDILGFGTVQVRAVIATTSLAATARLAGYSRPSQMFNLCETGNTREIEKAMTESGTVFLTRLQGLVDDPWFRRIPGGAR